MYRKRKTRAAYQPEKNMTNLRSGSADCPFCKPMQKLIIEKSAKAMVLKNIFSYQYWEFMDVVEHLLVVPKRHVEMLSELDDSELLAVSKLTAKYEKKGFNIYAREPKNTMKSVPHQHSHLLKISNKKAKFGLYSKKPYFTWKF